MNSVGFSFCGAFLTKRELIYFRPLVIHMKAREYSRLVPIREETSGIVRTHKRNLVYISATNEDFLEYSPDVIRNLEKKRLCEIYRKDNADHPYAEDSFEADFSEIDVFVFLVSNKLLNDPDSYCFKEDLEYAIRNRRPIFPILVEDVSLKQYEERFGSIQFTQIDLEGVNYIEKIQDFFKNQVETDEQYNEVKDFFKHHLFLSYRKKDKGIARELIALIHSDQRFESINIWYDDFLRTGEDYNEDINEEIAKSDYFLILATDNILEKDNYVLKNEYPKAKELGKTIIPIIVHNNRVPETKSTFPETGNYIYFEYNNSLDRLANIIAPIIGSRKIDLRSLSLLGSAYLYGVMVETNVKKGLEILTGVANKGYPPAMYLLGTYYKNFTSEINTAIDWFERNYYALSAIDLSGHIEKKINLLFEIGKLYIEKEQYEKAIETFNKILGLGDARDLDNNVIAAALNNIGDSYLSLGDTKKGCDYFERVYELTKDRNEEEYLVYKSNYFTVRLRLMDGGMIEADYKELEQNMTPMVNAYKELYGELNGSYLKALSDLGIVEKRAGKFDLAIEILEKHCALSRENERLGYINGHHEVISSLLNLSSAYRGAEKGKDALKAALEALELSKDGRSSNKTDVFLAERAAILSATEAKDFIFDEAFLDSHIEKCKALKNRVVSLEDSYGSVGSYYRSKKEYSKAIPYLLEYFKLVKSGESLLGEQEKEALVYCYLEANNDYPKAIETEEEAAKLFLERSVPLGKYKGYYTSLINRALLFCEIHDYGNAIKIFDEHYEKAKEHIFESALYRATVEYYVALTHFQRNDEAKHYLDEIIRMRENTTNEYVKQFDFNPYFNKGFDLFRSHDFRGALRYLLIPFEEKTVLAKYGRLKISGLCYLHIKDVASFKQCFLSCLDLLSHSGDKNADFMTEALFFDVIFAIIMSDSDEEVLNDVTHHERFSLSPSNIEKLCDICRKRNRESLTYYLKRNRS